MKTLLDQFVREEATPDVRTLILGVVHEHEDRPNALERKFEFNRFEVTVDFSSDSVLIEDVLDCETSGEVRIRLGEFVSVLSAPQRP